MSEPLLDAAKNGDERAFRDLVAPFRGELRAHFYRMAGSLSDAEDLLQESLLRAWRGLRGFEGRSSVRTWLYRVTNSACIDALEKKSPRMLPLDAGPPFPESAEVETPLAEVVKAAFDSGVQAERTRMGEILTVPGVASYPTTKGYPTRGVLLPTVTS